MKRGHYPGRVQPPRAGLPREWNSGALHSPRCRCSRCLRAGVRSRRTSLPGRAGSHAHIPPPGSSKSDCDNKHNGSGDLEGASRPLETLHDPQAVEGHLLKEDLPCFVK